MTGYQIFDLISGYALAYTLPTFWAVGLSLLAVKKLRRHSAQRPPQQQKPEQPPPSPPQYEVFICYPLLDIKKPANESLTRGEVLAAYRRSAKLFHPDRGATHEAFIALVAEREKALKAAL